MCHPKVIGVQVPTVKLASTRRALKVVRALALPPVPNHVEGIGERLAAVATCAVVGGR